MKSISLLLRWSVRSWLRSMAIVGVAYAFFELFLRFGVFGLNHEGIRVVALFIASLWAFFIPSRYNVANLSWIRSLPISRRALIGYLTVSILAAFALAALPVGWGVFVAMQSIAQKTPLPIGAGTAGPASSAHGSFALGAEATSALIWVVPLVILFGSWFVFSLTHLAMNSEAARELPRGFKQRVWALGLLYGFSWLIAGTSVAILAAFCFETFFYIKSQLRYGLQLPKNWRFRMDLLAGTVAALPLLGVVLSGVAVGSKATGAKLIFLKRDLGHLVRSPTLADYRAAYQSASPSERAELREILAHDHPSDLVLPEKLAGRARLGLSRSELTQTAVDQVLTPSFLLEEAKRAAPVDVLLAESSLKNFSAEQALLLVEGLGARPLERGIESRLALQSMTSPEGVIDWLQKSKTPLSFRVGLTAAQTFGYSPTLARLIDQKRRALESSLPFADQTRAFVVARLLEGQRPRFGGAAFEESLTPLRGPASQGTSGPTAPVEPGFKCGAANAESWLKESEAARNLCARALARERNDFRLLRDLSGRGWLTSEEFDRDYAPRVRALTHLSDGSF